jgi:hypothetical protein
MWYSMAGTVCLTSCLWVAFDTHLFPTSPPVLLLSSLLLAVSGSIGVPVVAFGEWLWLGGFFLCVHSISCSV